MAEPPEAQGHLMALITGGKGRTVPRDGSRYVTTMWPIVVTPIVVTPIVVIT